MCRTRILSSFELFFIIPYSFHQKYFEETIKMFNYLISDLKYKRIVENIYIQVILCMYLTIQQVERAVLKRTINFVFAKDKKMYDVSTVKHRTMRCAC